MRSRLPASVFWLLPLAGYWLVLIYYLGAQWSVYEQYRYGWAVPVLCLYLVWRKAESRKQKAESTGGKAEKLKTGLRDYGTKGQPDYGTTGLRDEGTTGPRDHGTTGLRDYGTGPVVSNPVVLWSLVLCALLYAPTRFLHEANPVWRLTSLFWALEVIGLTLLVTHLFEEGRGRRWEKAEMLKAETLKSAVAGKSEVSGQCSVVPWSRSLLFPVCFFLVAVPWPSGLENFLTQSLMRLNTATTVELLGFFGIPAVQHGNVIEVSTGVVGIDEACSGIRSLQATLMISLFFGELYALSARRRALCVLAGFALAFIFNVGRTLLLTRVAAAKGVGAVASWHDPAGVSILVACFLSLWLIARALQKAESRGGKAESRKQKAEEGPRDHGTTGRRDDGTTGPRDHGTGPVVSSPVVLWSRSLVVPCSLLAAWLLVVEGGTEIWYQSHERAAVGRADWSVGRPAQGGSYTEVPIPPAIGGQFNADNETQVRWQDGGGNSWQLYYFRWLPAHSLKHRVAVQLAKTHGPEKCLPAAGMSLKADLGIITVPLAGMDLAMQQYVFNAEGTPLHVFYGIYEDPTGSTQLANRRKNAASRVAAAMSGSRNYGQRFLEVAVVGYEKPEEARAALVRELGKVISMGNAETLKR